jgi:nicotinamidase-related amidase
MSKKLYIGIDMQNDFIDGSLGTKEAVAIVPNVIKLLKRAREEGSQIWFTRDTHQENYADTREGKHLPVTHCIKGTDGWHIKNDIFAKVWGTDTFAVKIFDKPTFGSVELLKAIQEILPDVDEIIFFGLCTDICVISNVSLAKAVAYEKEITVYEDCCAGVTPESHQKAIDIMRDSLQINIKTLQD